MMRIIIILLLFYSVNCFSYLVRDVSINCTPSTTCDFFKKNMTILRRDYSNREEFFKLLKIFYSKIGYSKFQYELIESPKGASLNIILKTSKTIKEIFFNVEEDEISELSLSSTLEINEGEYLDWYRLEEDEKRMLRKLRLQGFPDAKITKEIVEFGPQEVELYFTVKAGLPEKVRNITHTCKGGYIKNLMDNYFHDFKGKLFNKENIIQEMKSLETDLMGQGYYLTNVQYKAEKFGRNVDVVISCGNTQRVVLTLKDQNSFYTKEDIYYQLREYFQTTQRSFSESDLKRVVEEIYVKKGFFRPLVAINNLQVRENGEEYNRATVVIGKSKRLRVSEVAFKGAGFYLEEELIDFFYKNSSDLASAKYIDEDYYNLFTQLLKNKYMSAGFVDASIKYYVKTLSPQTRSVLFVINEGSRSIVREIRVSGKKVERLSGLKLGDPFNPLSFGQTLSSFLSEVKSEGYFFAEINNEDDKEVVRYFNGNREVRININLSKGKKSRVRNLLIFGVEKTKKSVVRRQLNYLYESHLTPSLVKDIYSDIASLGIFKNYNVTFLRGANEEVDIVVNVEEKEYGVFELAPGFRSDLGLKVWSRISRSNLLGRNQTLSLTTQVNYRLSLSEIDQDRTSEKLYEYLARLNYIYPDFFKTYWDYFATISMSRMRFYSFDAEIERFSNTFRKEFSFKKLIDGWDWRHSFSLTHQLENIEQYGADPIVNPEDNDTFRIGSITPSLTLNFLDKENPTVPKKGTLFQLSWEIAQPGLLSQSEDDLTIDFDKKVFRNRFYIPFSENFYLASSIAVGVQTNRGGTRIPAIKVFRLTGVDIVRGFAEDEINIVDDGSNLDIADIDITNRAFMSNYKIEPRYIIDDSMMLGVFYDAGSVQVDTYRPFDVRSSVGLSFKYVTPVGTLDFDYGIKLSRRRFSDGTKESPGRIHVSIGFF